MKLINTTFFTFSCLVLSSCASGPPRVPDWRPAPSAWVLEWTSPQKVSGTREFRLIRPSVPSLLLVGEAESNNDDTRLSFRELRWFSVWANGWTEARFLVSGEAVVRPGPNGLSLIASVEPTLESVQEATLRYFDTYLRGSRGLAEVSNRWDRIQAVAGHLLAGSDSVPPAKLDGFLFPEVFGYETPPLENHGRVTVYGMEWNTDYSRDHFPESLRGLRDSGTLYRDFEEAPGLWGLALQWNSWWQQPADVNLSK